MSEVIIVFGLAALIGVSLGLIGGGGSILTVPVFIYLMEMDAKTATAYSLFVVGISSLVGSATYIRKGQIDFKTGTVFAIPSLLAVFFTRSVLVPRIPDELFVIGGRVITGDMGIMIFFATVMIMAAYSMIKRRPIPQELEKKKFKYGLVILEGIVVGMVTGIVGAGGGFLIVPALVILAGMPMKRAIGTSLLIIAGKSLFGFIGDMGNPQIGGGSIDWQFLLLFSGFAIIGILIGSGLNKVVPGAKLKRAFGFFVLAMGIFIMIERVNAIKKSEQKTSTIQTEQIEYVTAVTD